MIFFFVIPIYLEKRAVENKKFITPPSFSLFCCFIELLVLACSTWFYRLSHTDPRTGLGIMGLCDFYPSARFAE
jgi:hypothetical protein